MLAPRLNRAERVAATGRDALGAEVLKIWLDALGVSAQDTNGMGTERLAIDWFLGFIFKGQNVASYNMFYI